ncbi:hypothetical protein Hanom_Chr08g00736581 [Helianthus anomalus]
MNKASKDSSFGKTQIKTKNKPPHTLISGPLPPPHTAVHRHPPVHHPTTASSGFDEDLRVQQS